jgi:peroxiredoxin
MSLTPTKQIPLGHTAPNFTLPDVTSGKDVSLNDINGDKGTAVMLICNHCPYVIHVIDELVKLATDYQKKGIGFVAISSNDVENYPQDSPEKMKEFAAENDFPFPYLYDESQEIAKAYDAACTPDFYLFDAHLKCVYRGQFDGSRPDNDVPVTGEDLRHAVMALTAGVANDRPQKPSMGCNVKWRETPVF